YLCKRSIDIFAIAPDGHVWSTAYGPDADGKWDWRGWFQILNETFIIGSRVTAISRKMNQIDLFAVNLEGEGEQQHGHQKQTAEIGEDGGGSQKQMDISLWERLYRSSIGAKTISISLQSASTAMFGRQLGDRKTMAGKDGVANRRCEIDSRGCGCCSLT
ncbi:hypothetical protein VU08_08425, partial [Desulfobulbus sp. F5]|nr:hypothetical protein [Desulfobulbus sp. F5]